MTTDEYRTPTRKVKAEPSRAMRRVRSYCTHAACGQIEWATSACGSWGTAVLNYKLGNRHRRSAGGTAREDGTGDPGAGGGGPDRPAWRGRLHRTAIASPICATLSRCALWGGEGVFFVSMVK